MLVELPLSPSVSLVFLGLSIAVMQSNNIVKGTSSRLRLVCLLCSLLYCKVGLFVCTYMQAVTSRSILPV